MACQSEYPHLGRDVPSFLKKIHEAITTLTTPAESSSETPSPNYTPVVSVRKSLSHKDHIISMIDGSPHKALRRDLSKHGLTPEQYRERNNFKVAENNSENRRAMAEKIGLGRKPVKKGVDAKTKAPAAKTRRPKTKPMDASAA